MINNVKKESETALFFFAKMKRRNALYVQKIENIKETQRRVHGRTLCFFYARFIYERSNHSKCRKHTYGKPGIPVSGYGDRKGGDLAGYTVYLWKQGLLVCV